MKDKKSLLRRVQDGWVNALAGLGFKMDKRSKTKYGNYSIAPDEELEQIYIGDGVGARIIDVVADDMTREWITLEGKNKEDQENENIKIVEETLNQLKAESMYNRALKWKRLYGGAIIIVGAFDGQDLEKPLIPGRISAINSLHVVDKSDVDLYQSVFQENPSVEGYGQPVKYYIYFQNKNTRIGHLVHASRCIVFNGKAIPHGISSIVTWEQRFWGISELQQVYEALRDYGGAIESIGNILYELVIGKFKLEHLAEMLEAGNEGAIATRLEIINMSKSIINAVVLGENEDYIRDSINLGGVPEILDRFMLRMSAVTGIPATRLWGRSPAGLNSTGESDTNIYYDMIKAKQKNELKSELNQLIEIIKEWKKITETMEIKFNPLFQLSENEQKENEKKEAERQKIEADMYQVYLDMGVLSPDQIYALRWEAPLKNVSVESGGSEELESTNEAEVIQ
jgi:hypothetical protein